MEQGPLPNLSLRGAGEKSHRGRVESNSKREMVEWYELWSDGCGGACFVHFGFVCLMQLV